MAGFFKKLFNRITGKPGEPTKVEEATVVAAPALEAPSAPAEEAVAPHPAAVPKSPKPKKSVPPPAKKTAPKVKETFVKKTKVAPAKPSPAKAKVKPVAIAKPAAPQPKAAKPAPAQKPKALAPLTKAPSPVVRPERKIIADFPPPFVEEPVTAKPAKSVVVAPIAPEVPAVPPPQSGGWFSRLKTGLSKSSKSITGSITAIFTKRKLDKETLQELEDTLIQADLGLAVSERIIAAVSHGRYDKEIDPEEVKQILATEVAKVLKPVEVPFNFGAEKPFVILVVGVNGSGKTTTIGKLGSIAAGEGFKVMFAACDTFRAAAIEQLTVWGNRIGATTMSRPTGADSAGLAFDALKQAREDGTDILFIDTAGRLQNKAYLMDELDKVVRVIKKQDEAAPHAVLLVLDATTGQNALAQAEIFTKVAGVTGLIMTKLDGTARGGILVAIAEKFKLPIHAIGVGESIDDLQPFDAEAFSRAIAGFED
jgi:fused signal recognition particle receptor